MAEMMTLRELHDHCKDGVRYTCLCGAEAFLRDDMVVREVGYVLESGDASSRKLAHFFARLHAAHTPMLVGTGKCSCGRTKPHQVPGLEFGKAGGS